MEKNYNSNRGKLNLREYGRNILQMIETLKDIKDKKNRTKKAAFIIDVMGNINPTLRDSNDYKHKLWDHLFVMANFDLDIDSPYPIPTRDALDIAPEKLPYPQKYFSHKQYGKNIRQVIVALSDLDDNIIRDRALADIAKFMKYKSFEYNKEYPSDEVILNDIRKFCNKDIQISSDVLNGTKITVNRNNNKLNRKRPMNNSKISSNNRYTKKY